MAEGLKFSKRAFDDPAVWFLDFPSSVTSVDIPVFFFAGRHDYDTPHELVAQYFPMILAPEKGLLWFERSAHFPFYEEPELFNQTLIRLKGQITPGQSPGS